MVIYLTIKLIIFFLCFSPIGSCTASSSCATYNNRLQKNYIDYDSDEYEIRDNEKVIALRPKYKGAEAGNLDKNKFKKFESDKRFVDSHDSSSVDKV